MKKVRVRVPASSANLGPGYDVLGVALNLFNEIEAQALPALRGLPSVEIRVRGEGAGGLARDERNIAWQAMKRTFKRAGFPFSRLRFRLKMINRIPLARGLGSSAAAILGGVLAANALSGGRLSKKDVLDLAAAIEGHPDNVAPQLFGGLCVSAHLNGGAFCVRLDPPKGVSAVVCVPSFELSTKKARSVIPGTIPHKDAVFNVSRVSFLLSSLVTGDYGGLKLAMQDRLHQIYRKKWVPGFDAVVRNGYRAGAFGVALSGAGPSILALAPVSKARRVGKEMEKGFSSSGKSSRSLILSFNIKGAEVTALK